MKYGVYVIKDIKTTYMQPMIDTNDESAIRGFKMAMANDNNPLFKFAPSDFELYKIGTYDSEKGVIKPQDKLLLITGGIKTDEVQD